MIIYCQLRMRFLAAGIVVHVGESYITHDRHKETLDIESKK